MTMALEKKDRFDFMYRDVDNELSYYVFILKRKHPKSLALLRSMAGIEFEYFKTYIIPLKLLGPPYL